MRIKTKKTVITALAILALLRITQAHADDWPPVTSENHHEWVRRTEQWLIAKKVFEKCPEWGKTYSVNDMLTMQIIVSGIQRNYPDIYYEVLKSIEPGIDGNPKSFCKIMTQ